MSKTISNACTKKSGNLLKAPSVYIYIYAKPFAGCYTRSFFRCLFPWSAAIPILKKQSFLLFNQSSWERIVGYVPHPRILALCEMKIDLTRNRTRIPVSISYDDNYYTINYWSNSWKIIYLRQEHTEPYNCANDYYWIEFLMFDRNIWIHLTLYKLFFLMIVWWSYSCW